MSETRLCQSKEEFPNQWDALLQRHNHASLKLVTSSTSGRSKSLFAAFPDFQSTLQVYSSTFQPESISPAWQMTQSAVGSPLCTGKLDFNVPDDVTFPADKNVNL